VQKEKVQKVQKIETAQTEKNDTKKFVSFKEQLTLRGIIIGIAGSAILTMSSMYVALKLGALPWPIIFVTLLSMFFLKLFGKTNIHEINVTQTAMSAGAMTAGGVAFTLPGIFILNPDAVLDPLQLFFAIAGGVILGLIFSALIRSYFIEDEDLPYAMGQAAAETLSAGDEGGKKAGVLFASFGLSAVVTFLRDAFPLIAHNKVLIPPTVLSKKAAEFGSSAGIWVSPMLISIGYIIGPLAIGVWFLGAIIGDGGILIGGVLTGLWDTTSAAAIKSSLGIGLMVGTGAGILVRGIIPKAKKIFTQVSKKTSLESGFVKFRWSALVIAAIAAVFTVVCKMGFLPSVITIFGTWLAMTMSAQVVGQTGINPMEIFAIIVLLAVKALCDVGQTELFLVAAVVAIAAGVSGDVMNDFKSGHILKSDPKAQWLAECAGGIAGILVSFAVFYAIIAAYGHNAFGAGKMFAAPKAEAVAAMAGGIQQVPAFVFGLVAGCLLYILKIPAMTLGLGVYLPFSLSFTAFAGGALRFICARTSPRFEKRGSGIIIASGILGGEAVVGVTIAIVQAISGFSTF
jgi:uncharacterized oligopeptide transporter (OPT) family protein